MRLWYMQQERCSKPDQKLCAHLRRVPPGRWLQCQIAQIRNGKTRLIKEFRLRPNQWGGKRRGWDTLLAICRFWFTVLGVLSLRFLVHYNRCITKVQKQAPSMQHIKDARETVSAWNEIHKLLQSLIWLCARKPPGSFWELRTRHFDRFWHTD